MPELPEVETIKRDLKKTILGKRIEEVVIFDKRVIKDLSARRFIQQAKGCTFKDVWRRGKAIVIVLDQQRYLVVQVKMTGQLIYQPKWNQESRLKETKVVFRLSNGYHLLYNDQRLFGWLYLVGDLNKIPCLTTIGPEPLNGEFTTEWLYNALKKRRTPIKTLLMNQVFLAGIGNIYASEILFRARIHPQKVSQKLNKKEIDALHLSIKNILEEAIRCRGTSIRNYRDVEGKKGKFINRIKVYGREKESCYVCKEPIHRIVQGGRSTFFCKHCQ